MRRLLLLGLVVAVSLLAALGCRNESTEPVKKTDRSFLDRVPKQTNPKKIR